MVEENRMKNCSTCRFNTNKHCSHPNNYQPQVHQYMIVKPFSPRFYPKPPSWCKGYEAINRLYCIKCGKDVRTIFKCFHINFVKVTDYVTKQEICYGPFTQCPPPPILNNDEWETVFSRESLISD